MKKIKLLSLCMLALTFIFTGCNPEKEKPDVDNIVEDGFYVVGEASAIANLTVDGAAKSIMANGINENDGQKTRDGMYEKYIALEGGKPFQLVLKEGKSETIYGARLELSETLTGDNEPAIQVYKGVMTANTTMQVKESGLYHIVLDLNKDGKLSDKLILVAPVNFGIRGGMNGWGFTELTPSAFDKSKMTLTLKDVEVTGDTEFKFAYGGGWKIQLNSLSDATGPEDPRYVKANTNLGNDSESDGEALMPNKLKPGGKNIAIARGVYTITLTWSLTQGDIKGSFVASIEKTGESQAPEYPEHIYMIGSSIGGWDWSGNYIITLNPVHSHPHAFWAIAYIDAPATDPGFKFSPAKEWSGDFGKSGDAVDGIYDKGGENLTVATAGYYMVYVDLKTNKISVTAPTVYGIGDAFGGWDSGVAANLFTVDNTAKTITSPAFTNNGELRIHTTSPLAVKDEAPVDWWQMEFIVLDGKIAYRANGNDQDRVAVTAGQKVSLNFQAGTGTIK